MDDHSKLQLIYKLHTHMCVIAKSYRYVQNVKDWRYEFIDQDIINCKLKCLIALMGYTKMLQRLNAKRCKTFYCCNLQYEKKNHAKFHFKYFFLSLLQQTQNQMNKLKSYLILTSNVFDMSWSWNFSRYKQLLGIIWFI